MSFSEIVLLMAIALILFGPEDLPDIARAIGKIVYEIRKATSELTEGFKEIVDSPMNTLNKAFEETTGRTAVAKPAPDDEPQDLITYEGKPVGGTEGSGTQVKAEDSPDNTDNPDQVAVSKGKDPLAELPPGMVTYEEKGTSR